MAKKSNVVPTTSSSGHKSAYVARNRAALIRAAQQVFADLGPTATMEAVATQAEVAPSTVYKHFGTKEALLEIAILEAFSTWQEWAQEKTSDVTDPVARLVIPMRFFIRLRSTHPLYAALVSSVFGEMHKYLPITNTGFAENLQYLNQSKILSNDNLDIRVQNLGACLFGILDVQLHQPDSNAEDADTALEYALPMIGITPAKAKKLAHSPLPKLN